MYSVLKKKPDDSKACYDSLIRVMMRIVVEGDWVCVKLPENRVRKGELRFSYPQEVDEMSENGSAVRLVNGQWCNCDTVAKVRPPTQCDKVN